MFSRKPEGFVLHHSLSGKLRLLALVGGNTGMEWNPFVARKGELTLTENERMSRMSLRKGTIQKEISSFNHQFWGAMLVFGGVMMFCLPLLNEDAYRLFADVRSANWNWQLRHGRSPPPQTELDLDLPVLVIPDTPGHEIVGRVE